MTTGAEEVVAEAWADWQDAVKRLALAVLADELGLRPYDVIAPSTYPIARLNSAPVMSSTAVYTLTTTASQPRPGSWLPA